MPNAGYPDDDGSRTPAGDHDLGRQRGTVYPVANMLTPATIADMAGNRDPLNVRTESAGDLTVPNHGWPVDGRASAGTAAFPPKPEDPNSRD